MLWLLGKPIGIRQTSLNAHIHYLQEDRFILRNTSFHENNGCDYRYPLKSYCEDEEFSRNFSIQLSKYELLQELLNDDSDYAKLLKIRKNCHLLESKEAKDQGLFSNDPFNDFELNL